MITRKELLPSCQNYPFYMNKLSFTLILLWATCITGFAQLPFLNEIDPAPSIVWHDFVYGNKPRNLLRLYTPNNQVSKPLFVLVLGSGFQNPQIPLRNQYEAQARSYAKRGYAVLVIEYYRVIDPCPAFEKVVGEAAADVHAAIQYAIKYKGAWNINPNYIFIDGLSAGGIAATAAIWLGDTKFKKKFGFSKNKNSLDSTITYTIKGLALESSGVMDMSIFNDADINNSIPIMMAQGIRDKTVPYLCDTSVLCQSPKRGAYVCGTGSILESITNTSVGNPKRNTCYMMYQYNTNKHDLSTSGPNMPVNLATNVATAFAWIIAGKPCVQNAVFLNPSRVGQDDETISKDIDSSTDQIQFNDDQISFQFSAETPTSQFRLFDLSGTERKALSVNKNFVISTSELNAGIYIGVLQTDNGVFKKKIVIQR